MPLTPSQSQPCTLATDLGVTGTFGAVFNFTNPLAGSVQLSNVIVEVGAGLPGVRFVQVTVNDENGNRRLFMRSKGIQIGGQTVLHSFVQGDSTVIVGGNTFNTDMPPGFFMRKDWVIVSAVSGFLIGDTQRVMFQLLR